MQENTAQKSNSNTTSRPLLIIGQDMHIMNPVLTRAIEARDANRLTAMAAQQVKAGAHALDLNLGPLKKNRSQTRWAVETIRNTVDVPLFISSHVLSRPEILDMHRQTATINSVTADPANLTADMATAKSHSCRLVVLLVRPGLTPFSVDDRLQVAAEVLETANRTEFPLADLYLDPLFHLRPDPMTWQLSRGVPDVDSVLGTIEMLPQLAGEKIHTLLALSGASRFLPGPERSALHCRLLPMLMAAGLDAVILNSHDSRLMEIARNPVVGSKHNQSQRIPVHADMDTAALPW